MKRLLSALIVLSVVTLGLTACRKNHITIVETSYMVTHPAAHKGDVLIFEAPSPGPGKSLHVHFYPGESPCAEKKIPLVDGGPLKCTVAVSSTTDIRYLYYIDTNKEILQEQNEAIKNGAPVSRCPPCCPQCQVFVGKSSLGAAPQTPRSQPASTYAAVEILIDKDNTGLPVAAPSSAFPTQPVTWFKVAPDSGGWSVRFTSDVCVEKQPIVSVDGEAAYCTVKNTLPTGLYYPYTITVDGKTGSSSQLYVSPPVPPPPSTTNSNPQ